MNECYRQINKGLAFEIFSHSSKWKFSNWRNVSMKIQDGFLFSSNYRNHYLKFLRTYRILRLRTIIHLRFWGFFSSFFLSLLERERESRGRGNINLASCPTWIPISGSISGPQNTEFLLIMNTLKINHSFWKNIYITLFVSINLLVALLHNLVNTLTT